MLDLDRVDKVLEAEVAQRHSLFQLKYFVIGKEPTIQSKMWQCLRELKGRREALAAIDRETEEAHDQLEMISIESERHAFKVASYAESPMGGKIAELEAREQALVSRKLIRQKAAAEARIGQLAERRKWTEQEAEFFLETFETLSGSEELKNFDDLESQKRYWGERLASKLNLKMLLHAPLDTELVETVMALPDDVPVKQNVMRQLQSSHKQMAELASKLNKLPAKE